MTEVFEMTLAVVYSDYEEVTDTTDCKIRTMEEATAIASSYVKEKMEEVIPRGKFCSLIIGSKLEIYDSDEAPRGDEREDIPGEIE